MFKQLSSVAIISTALLLCGCNNMAKYGPASLGGSNGSPTPTPIPVSIPVSDEELVVYNGSLSIRKDGVKRTIECKDGSLAVRFNNCELSISDNCTEVRLSGSGNVINAESIGSLQLESKSSRNTVNVKKLKDVWASGSSNKVLYELGQGGLQPEIKNVGAGNSIKQGKAVAPVVKK